MNTDAELCKRTENEWNTLSTDLIVTVWEEEMKRIKIGEPGPGRRVTVNSWMQTDEENPLLKPGDALVCVLVCACLWSVLIYHLAILPWSVHIALTTTEKKANNREKVKGLSWSICVHGDSRFNPLIVFQVPSSQSELSKLTEEPENKVQRILHEFILQTNLNDEIPLSKLTFTFLVFIDDYRFLSHALRIMSHYSTSKSY